MPIVPVIKKGHIRYGLYTMIEDEKEKLFLYIFHGECDASDGILPDQDLDQKKPIVAVEMYDRSIDSLIEMLRRAREHIERQGEEYGLHSKFDPEKHAKMYPNYLEVLITDAGEVLYAVPSHQELAISLACRKLGVTRDQLDNMCPPEYYCDFINWLSMQTGAIAVWDAFYVGKANDKQIKTLKMLKEKGIYHGKIESEEKNDGQNE